MKPSRVAEVLEKLVRTKWPAFVWGPPGVGKSSIVREVARSLDREVLDLRAALLDPTDIRGIPNISGGKAVWCPPSFLPGDPKSKGILFLDELSSAPPLVQASLYQLTLDRRVGEYQLPVGWSIVAAGNRAQDASISFRMPAALSNRFVHLDYEIDFQDWRNWATTHDIHPLVVAFLAVRPNLLFDASRPEKGFPTPRSWEMVSDTLRLFTAPRDASDVLMGVVGEGAAVEFLAFVNDSRIAEIVEKILEDPDHADIPKKLDLMFALVSYLVAGLKEKRVLEAALRLLSRLEPEVGVLLVRDIVRINPLAMARQEVRAFTDLHKSVLLP